MQDEWRARSNLTFNIGVRYEYTEPFHEKYGHLANLDIAPNFTAVTVITPQTPGVPESLIDPDRNNLAPRLGFAYRPFKQKQASASRRIQHLLRWVSVQLDRRPVSRPAAVCEHRLTADQLLAKTHDPGRVR